MAKFKEIFAKLEPSFISGKSKMGMVFVGLPPSTQLTYIRMWCNCVENRRTYIEVPYNLKSSSHLPNGILQRTYGVPGKDIQSSLNDLVRTSLISFDGKRYNMLKIKEIHGDKLKWKDDNGSINPDNGEELELDKELDKELEGEGISSPPPPTLDDKNQLTQTPLKTPAPPPDSPDNSKNILTEISEAWNLVRRDFDLDPEFITPKYQEALRVISGFNISIQELTRMLFRFLSSDDEYFVKKGFTLNTFMNDANAFSDSFYKVTLKSDPTKELTNEAG